MATVASTRPRAGRNAELGLLGLAVAVGIGAYLIIGLNLDGALPSDLLRYSLLVVGLAVGLHLVLRWRAPDADPVMLPVVVGLNGLGLAMIHRIDIALDARGLNSGFASRQLLWTILGVALAAAVIIFLRDHRSLRRYPFLAMIAGLVLLVLPMAPVIGQTINGARLWIGIGPLSFQPAELAKILLAIFFAGYFVQRRDALTLAGTRMLGMQLPRFADLAPIVVIWLVSVGVLVLERDLGTSLLFFGMFVAMLYVATEKVSWIVIGLVLVAVGVAFAYVTFDYVAARFDVWLHALDSEIYNRDPGGSGQLVRGLFGFAAGGLMGTGLGQGHPDLVPYANSDFIVASFGEELGLTGLLAILMLYLVLAERGLRAAIGVRDGFGKLLASGFAFVIAFQVFIVVGGVTRLIPLTGLTMPFMAAGGSSLVANWIIVAILLRISDAARRPSPAGAGGVVGNETALIALGSSAAVSGARSATSSPSSRPSAFGWDNLDDDDPAPGQYGYVDPPQAPSSLEDDADFDESLASSPTEYIRRPGARTVGTGTDKPTDIGNSPDDGGMSRAALDGPGGSARGTSARMVDAARDIPPASDENATTVVGHQSQPSSPDGDEPDDDNPTQVVKP